MTDGLSIVGRLEPMGITVTDGRRTEIDAYVNLLVEVFVDDPLVAEQAGPHPEAALRVQFTAMIDAVYLEAGAVDVARDGDEVVGVASAEWTPTRRRPTWKPRPHVSRRCTDAMVSARSRCCTSVTRRCMPCCARCRSAPQPRQRRRRLLSHLGLRLSED